MFICYKCGYQYYSDKDKTTCPICGSNILVPKFALFLFLSIVVYILLCIISMFNSDFSIYAVVTVTVTFIILPLAIFEMGERYNEVQDGFRAPDYPSEVQNGCARVPVFQTFDYVGGLENDDGVKKILFEVHDNGLNYYYSGLSEIRTIDYNEIVNLEIYDENKVCMSPAKSAIYASLLASVGGMPIGILGGAIGGIESKNRSVLKIQVLHDNKINNLYLSSSKSELKRFAYDIENKVNE